MSKTCPAVEEFDVSVSRGEKSRNTHKHWPECSREMEGSGCGLMWLAAVLRLEAL